MSAAVSPVITVANLDLHRAALIELNIEYVSWVMQGIERLQGVSAREVLGMSVAEYVPTIIDKVCGETPPSGAFYIVEVDGKLAGMGGLRRLREGAAEFKRVYVRPGFRGASIGQSLVTRLLGDARSFGYRDVFLDTVLFMESAQRLYEANGFAYCAAYEGIEAPKGMHASIRFMHKTL
ncbi:hypothetical protein BH09PSE6_BH09PSE6_11470 [soil metagenome]